MISDFDEFAQANPDLDPHVAFAKFLNQQGWEGKMKRTVSVTDVDTVNFYQLKEEVRDLNKDKGWYDSERTFGDEMALLHTEVSEAYDAYRDGILKGGLDSTGKPIGVGSELADVFIRLLDTCVRYDIDLLKEFSTKMNYNWTRPHRHGGKVV